MFSLGVCLFIMVVGHPPFNDAKLTDKAFNFIATGQYDLFWEVHLGKSQIRKLDRNLKDLLQKMLCPDPRKRIGVQQVY